MRIAMILALALSVVALAACEDRATESTPRGDTGASLAGEKPTDVSDTKMFTLAVSGMT